MTQLLRTLIFVTLGVVAGCATSTDRLPPGTPKGYVEFYFSGDSSGGGFPGLYPRLHFREVFADGMEAQSVDVGDLSKSVQFSMVPGPHRLLATTGTNRQYLDINVVEEMVTRVKITWIVNHADIQRQWNNQTITRYFTVHYGIESPVAPK